MWTRISPNRFADDPPTLHGQTRPTHKKSGRRSLLATRSAGMALRSIRYGGGVWKQHEEVRLHLEAQVETCERELRLQRAEMAKVEAMHAALRGKLQETQLECTRLEETLATQSRVLSETQRQVHLATEQQTKSAQYIQRLQCERNALQSRWESHDELLHERDTQIQRLQAQVDAGVDEERALCALLYASQEKCEFLAMESETQRRHVRILTKANQTKARHCAALDAEKQQLAQKLARVRGASPKVCFHSRADKEMDSHREQQTRGELLMRSEKAMRGDEAEGNQSGDAENASIQSRESSQQQERTDGNGSSVAFAWKALQATSAKLRKERSVTAALRERVALLECSRRDLVARFREASAARQRAERKVALTR